MTEIWQTHIGRNVCADIKFGQSLTVVNKALNRKPNRIEKQNRKCNGVVCHKVAKQQMERNKRIFFERL